MGEINLKQHKVYRYELKYLISQGEYLYLKSLLSVILTPDKYSAELGDYFIRSVYFDTPYHRDYVEKIIGVCDRKKLRLRIYDFNQEMVKLEIKNRFNQYMLKETVTISKDMAIELLSAKYDSLLSLDNVIANKAFLYLYKDFYQPTVIVDYEREAYICPINSIRITFDKNIRTSTNVKSFFSPNLSTIEVMDEKKIVLEIKYNSMIPKYIRDILASVLGKEFCSVSKYCLSKSIVL